MSVSKKAITKKGLLYRYIFAVVLIIFGLILNVLDMGKTDFFSYGSVGNYLIFVGILVVFITLLIKFTRRNKIIDERHEKVAIKAMAWVWYFIFLGGFVVMILDGIKPFSMSISMFVAYAICFILIIYVIAYKILEKKY